MDVISSVVTLITVLAGLLIIRATVNDVLKYKREEFDKASAVSDLRLKSTIESYKTPDKEQDIDKTPDMSKLFVGIDKLYEDEDALTRLLGKE